MGEVTAKPLKVVIATPTLDKKVSSDYLVSLLGTVNLLSQYGVQVDISLVGGDCFIAKARNNLATTFMDGDGDQLFFIDADLGWEPEAAVRFVLNSCEFIAGVYPKKTDTGPQYNHAHLDHDEKFNCYIENGLLRASGVPTGFMRLKRSVFERFLQEPGVGNRYDPGDGSENVSHYRFFETSIIDGKFWGEDLLFCKRWCGFGKHVWVDPSCQFKHAGSKTWEGSLLVYLKTNATVKEVPNERAPTVG